LNTNLEPWLTIPAPQALWDLSDTLAIRPMSIDVLQALLHRLLTWKCPNNRPITHWSLRGLPFLMAHGVTPLIPRKRWEMVSPLAIEHLLVAWITHSFPASSTNAQPVMDYGPLLDSMQHIWNLASLAQLDVQLIAHTMPVPGSLLDQLWENPIKMRKLMDLFQLEADWPVDTAVSRWPYYYWKARLTGLGLPWHILSSPLVMKSTHVSAATRQFLSLLSAECPQIASTPIKSPKRLHTQNVLVLVEGQTEERLLPLLGQQVGIDPQQWWCCPVGGKSQMLATYEQAQYLLSLPIVVVLDADAYPVYQQLLERLRPQDRICLLADGELEDHLDPQWLADTLNKAFALHPALEAEYFNTGNRVQRLKALWRERQLGVFDKTTLASLLAETLRNTSI
jgi:hypothetical protein